jgi:hypothetical protein
MNSQSESDLQQEAEDWFASNFPRLFELYERSNKDEPKNYFNFKELFPIAYLGKQAYWEIERVISRLDSTAWERLSKKTLASVTADDPSRRYHQLFNHLNEARGYTYLLDEGYSRIEFIEDPTGKSADLVGTNDGSTALLEVKTVNQSDKDIRIEALGNNKAIKVDPLISEKFKTRIKRSIKNARKQLYSYKQRVDRKIVFLFIEMESPQRTCGESYLKLESFISDQNSKDLEVVGQASPMMLRF